jgi:tRNA(Ile)-lysidine synthase
MGVLVNSLLFPPSTPLIVAFSGGPDSVFLTETLLEHGFSSLTLAHFHHDLRGAESDQDEAFCEAFAKAKSLPYAMEKWNDPKKDENSAREARYAFFERVRQETNAEGIVLGHHADDQAETIFMQFLRGAGTSGLSGMKEWDEKRKLYRPLLGFWKQEILDFLQQKNISFRTDASNLSDVFSRNFLRNTVFPSLESRFQGFKERIIRNAELFCAVDDFLLASANEFLLAEEAGGGYEKEKFFALSMALQHQVVRMIFQRSIDFPFVQSVETFFRAAKSGSKMQKNGQEVLLYGGRFFLTPSYFSFY